VESGGIRVTGFKRQTEIFDRFVAPEIAGRPGTVESPTSWWTPSGGNFEGTARSSGRGFYRQIELAIGNGSEHTESGWRRCCPRRRADCMWRGKQSANRQTASDPAWGVLKNRADRVAYLKDRAGVPVVDLRLEEPRNFRRKLKDIGTAALILVTSREIDQSGEDEMTVARSIWNACCRI